jgi:hypothetical protein
MSLTLGQEQTLKKHDKTRILTKATKKKKGKLDNLRNEIVYKLLSLITLSLAREPL